MNKTRLALLSLLIAAIFGCAQQQPATQTSVPASSDFPTAHSTRPKSDNSSLFDFYLLNLSWSPEFCHGHPSAAECAQHPAFVLHGLWPEKADGSYPENCSNTPGPADPGQYADIYPDAGLLKHEWRTHGTCSGLDPDTFFKSARSAYRSVKVPAKLATLTSQVSMPPSQIAALFQQSNPGLSSASIVISCGNNYLTAVEVCLDKALQPTSCNAVKTCRANTVRIPNP